MSDLLRAKLDKKKTAPSAWMVPFCFVRRSLVWRKLIRLIWTNDS